MEQLANIFGDMQIKISSLKTYVSSLFYHYGLDTCNTAREEEFSLREVLLKCEGIHSAMEMILLVLESLEEDTEKYEKESWKK